jgi:hypothetical protein
LWEEAAKKEMDEQFNTIRLVIPTRQEWSVKKKTSAPALTASNDDMDLLDGDESPVIKDGSPSSIVMDINMVFTLSSEFREMTKSHSTVPQPQGSHVQETREVELALETFVHSRSHQREADF